MFSYSPPSRFERLAQRPPTPPREISEAVDEAIEFLDDSNEVDKVLKHSSPESNCRRPNHTPTKPWQLASDELPDSSNPAKRVDFSPWPTFHEPGDLAVHSSPTSRLDKNAPSVRDLRPVRSILKQSLSPLPPTPEELESRPAYFSSQEPGSFGKMLQSVQRQLSNSRPEQRLDAYLTLNGVLCAHERVPDVQDMMSNMTFFMQVLSRDMVCKPASETMDTNIAWQALKLVATILQRAQLSKCLDDDFRNHLIEQSVFVLEQPGIAKSVVKMHVFILALQNFGPQIMTPSRFDKLLASLHNIETRCSGNSTIATRLTVYKTLLKQNQRLMLAQTRYWLDHAFHGMLSTHDDTRNKAIDLTEDAGYTLGVQALAAKSIRDIFVMEHEDGMTYQRYFCQQLEKMIDDKTLAHHVPRVWSSVILFFRSKRAPLDTWSGLPSWARIIQRCLNSSDTQVLQQAAIAWNKLVFTISPDGNTAPTTFSMIVKPVEGAWRRRRPGHQVNPTRQNAGELFLNLIYYSLRPGLSPSELDRAWDGYVDPILNEMIQSGGPGGKFACQVLNGLLTPSDTLWTPDIAMRNVKLTPENLPRLDSKWTRSRFSKILKPVGSMLLANICSHSELSLITAEVISPLFTLIAEAGAHEIKTSYDLKEAMAALVNLFQRVWAKCVQSLQADGFIGFCDDLRSLVNCIVSHLGTISLTEDLLIRDPENGYAATFTPSSRSKPSSEPYSALTALFGLFYHPPTPVDTDSIQDAYLRLCDDVLDHLLSAAKTPVQQMKVLEKSLQTWNTIYESRDRKFVAALLWTKVSAHAADILKRAVSNVDAADLRNSTSLLQSSMHVLSSGLVHEDVFEGVHKSMVQLLAAMTATAEAAAGTGGVILTVIEPIAKTVISQSQSQGSRSIKLLASLLNVANWPRTKLELELASEKLWGTKLSTRKPSIFHPYENLYKLSILAMTAAYDQIKEGDSCTGSLLDLISAAIDFLERCPAETLGAALSRMQDGFVVLIRDSGTKLPVSGPVARGVSSMWTRLLQLMSAIASKDSDLLEALEPLLVAGFSSHKAAIVHECADLWNSNFGMQETLTYPSQLAAVLHARLHEIDLLVPGLAEHEEHDTLISLPPLAVAREGSSPRTDRQATPPCSSFPRLISSARKVTTRKPTGWSPVKRVISSSLPSSPQSRTAQGGDGLIVSIAYSQPIKLQSEGARGFEVHRRGDTSRHEPLIDVERSPLPETTYEPCDPVDLQQGELEEGDDLLTPSRKERSTNPPSDDLPSSPTPSSHRRLSHAINLADLEAEIDEDLHGVESQDLPSSPPRASDEMADDTMTNNHPVIEDDEAMEDDVVPSVETTPVDGFPNGLTKDGSDAISPEEQLREEQDAAAFPTRLEGDGQVPEATDKLEEPIGSSVSFSRDKNLVSTECEATVSADKSVSHDSDQSKDRVEDSFVNVVQTGFMPALTRSGKKRKRESAPTPARKKSIMAMFTQFLTGSQDPADQEEEDDDMEEEIVVASGPSLSSRATSVCTDGQMSRSVSPSRGEREPTPTSVVGVDIAGPRRRSSRAKKAAASPNANAAGTQMEAETKRGLKRRGSTSTVGSVAVGESPQIGIVVIQDSQDGRTSTNQVSTGHGESATTVHPTTPTRNSRFLDVSGGAASAGLGRVILTPRKMLDRLREVLQDLPSVVLGRKEEREFDDMLYQVRTQMHRAASRGEVDDDASGIGRE